MQKVLRQSVFAMLKSLRMVSYTASRLLKASISDAPTGPALIIDAPFHVDRYVLRLIVNGHYSRSDKLTKDAVIVAHQICPICAPIELRRAVVDPGSQRTLDSLPPRALTIEDLIITLPGCRHIFTVSVLDTACRLKEWYIYDDSLGRWTGLRTPDSRSSAGEIPILPLCPTCRTPITAARYGRVYKAASLAVLERNTIHLTIPSLNSGKVSVRHMAPSQIELGLEEAIFKLDSASIMSIKNVTQLARYNGGRKLLQTAAAGRKGPFPVQSLDPMNKKGPNPSPQIAKIWRAATRPLFDILVRLNKVANTRPLHTTAWDSAYSYLLDQEVNMIGSAGVDPANGSGDQAARAARAQVGQHQPRFHQQLLVEAILLSVHTRLILASLVILLLDHLADKPVTRLELQPWTTYCHFIHETCSEDTFTAAEIAKEGDAHRLQTLSQLYVLRAELEYLHFSYNMASRFGSVAEASGQLLGAIARHKTTTERISHDAIRRHLALLPQDGIWFKENFSTPITRFDAAAVSLERAVKFGTTTYDPSAIDWVRRHIPPSLLTSHSIKDHWRHCFNGHAYTVGPNHGCPECGE
ncbi:hypothetical protein CC1G_02001 [Coprinopsis cinerea okayama7|uniref:Uncharacterized protein n=1 Tax=Coprinopsis cinerea (strain Okayama-7 / 130 / ATCC MYA-4618 / FGSC 9003) TaxID=240176 RepID=A8N693_COPC7|nr:hypothetical protein CC1G_02001 [Coprinopsis cinerea okayama7\|eukprot:XP_001830365.2 hypothetical protein CC1G_02001 [Coprinopsis cinerea okayama7\